MTTIFKTFQDAIYNCNYILNGCDSHPRSIMSLNVYIFVHAHQIVSSLAGRRFVKLIAVLYTPSKLLFISTLSNTVLSLTIDMRSYVLRQTLSLQTR